MNEVVVSLVEVQVDVLGLGRLLLSLLFVNLVVLLYFSHLQDDLLAEGVALSNRFLVEYQLEEVIGDAIGHVVFLRVLPVERRREEQIQSQFERIVHHTGYDSF